MDEPQPQFPSNLEADEIVSLNFGSHTDLSIRESEVNYHSRVLDVAKDYGLERALDNEPAFVANDAYCSFPYLFLDAFADVDEESFDMIYSISRLLYVSTMFLDGVLDHKTTIEQESLLLAILLRERAIDLLNKVSKDSDELWGFFEKYQKEFVRAHVAESRRNSSHYSPYSLAEFEKIAAGKAAYAKMIPATLALLSRSSTQIGNFEKSIDAFFTAFQLRDDLRDWRLDFSDRQFSFILCKVIDRKALSEKIDSVSVDDVGRMIYFTEIAEQSIELMVSYYQDASAAVEGISCSDWKTAISKSQTECEEMLAKLQNYKEIELKRVSNLVKSGKANVLEQPN